MPWSVSDVDKHKKGLTAEQKKKWVSVANGVLKQCQKDGGKDCEGKAIRIANSKFSLPEKIPSASLCFKDSEGFAKLEFTEEDGEKKSPQLSIVGYSGKMIKNHWWWGDLMMDVDGMKPMKIPMPILEDHDTGKKIGFAKKVTMDDHMVKIMPAHSVMVDTEHSQEFVKLAKQGFPYEASLRVVPKKIEKLEEGTTGESNGQKVKGPCTIFRECELKEVSVCVFGWDSKSNATALSEEVLLEAELINHLEDEENNKTTEKEVKQMDLAQLKSEHPDLITQLTEEIKQTVTIQFNQEKQQWTIKGEELSQQILDKDKRILALEKEQTLQKENEAKKLADTLWEKELALCSIPERLHSKVQSHVVYSEFMKEGRLDETEFVKKIKEEIKDWEDKGANTKVMGMGVNQREIDEKAQKLAKEKEEIDKTTDGLLQLAGQKKK